jgi:HSP20 family protein
MNRLVNQVFVGGLPRQAEPEQQGTQVAGWTPSIDVIQRGEDLVVRAELPGARPEDVDITVHNGVLTISGRIQEEREEERGGYLVRERRSGSFRRSLHLPQDVDENEINARFENGVLEVTIPGAAAAQEPRRIQVEASESRVGTGGGPGARTEGPTTAETARPAEPGATSKPRDVPPRTTGTQEGVSPPRTEEGREGAGRQPDREREENEGLLDRAKDAILGEDEERRRREGTDRPEDRR